MIDIIAAVRAQLSLGQALSGGAGIAIVLVCPTMPLPLPLVAIERASGSVRETCLSGAASKCAWRPLPL